MKSLTRKFSDAAFSAIDKMAGVPRAVIAGGEAAFKKTANAFKEGGPNLGQALEKIAASRVVKAVTNTVTPTAKPPLPSSP